MTVAGALATGTHGSGINTTAISGHVRDIELLCADGETARFERDAVGVGAVSSEHVAGGHVGCLGVVSRMTLDVVPYFRGHNFWLWMPLDRLLRHWDDLTGDLHLGGTRRPRVDSHSILVWWQAGVCTILAKHFSPHYNPAVACSSPAWGRHPFGGPRWNLTATRFGDADSTLRAVGVHLAYTENSACCVVAQVVPGSLAQQAGIEPGWKLTKIGRSRVTHASDVEGVFVKSEKDVLGGPRWADEDSLEGDTSLAGKEPKIIVRFEDPKAGPPEQIPPPYTSVNHAYTGPWHDTVPAWALGQPVEDGPETNCGQQSEFFVPIANAVPALQVAWDIMRQWSVATNQKPDGGIIFLSEIRSIKRDCGWMSCTPVDSMSIHLSLSASPSRQPEIWREILKLEQALAPLGARPHWGKIYTASFWAPRFPELYGEGLTRFRKLSRQHDPEHKFITPWIDETMFASS